MENINIKDYIINNFKEDNKETIRNAISESIKENDEVVLPGMGVFLMLLWEGINEEMRENIVTILHQELQRHNK